MGLANIDGSFDLGADVIYRGEKPVMRGTMFLIILKKSKRIFNLEQLFLYNIFDRYTYLVASILHVACGPGRLFMPSTLLCLLPPWTYRFQSLFPTCHSALDDYSL